MTLFVEESLKIVDLQISLFNPIFSLLLIIVEKGDKFSSFFQQENETAKTNALDIYWFINEDDNPTEVANKVLQNNYDLFGSLPDWNKSFK